MKTVANPIRICSLLVLALLLTQCGTSVYYVTPPDLESRFTRDSTIAAYSKYLHDKTVFIDPGHGGSDRSSIGPAEDVVEADVNLEVATRLREFLRDAGANVIMSRLEDITIPLEARSEQANVNNADIFISVHHNAAGNAFTNYTSTFYHSRPGQPGYQPSSHDLARYIQRDLSYVLDNPGPLASFDGTMSDFLIYPGDGFSVLRKTKMTGVLVECSFFTSAYEEQRLKDPFYNEIEAWGIFRGIGKYFRAGIPVVRYLSQTVFESNQPKFDLVAEDPAGIDDQSIEIRIDGKDQGFLFDKQSGKMTVNAMNELAPGYHQLSVQVRNNNGNASSPFAVSFSIGAPPATIRASAMPPEIPSDPRAYSYIVIEAVDSLDRPVADGMPIRFSTSQGIDTLLLLSRGKAIAYIEPGTENEIRYSAANGPVKADGAVTVSSDAMYSRGLIMSADGKPIRSASIELPGGTAIQTNPIGEYIISGRRVDGLEVAVQADGYFGKREAFTGQLVQDPIVMSPVARGLLREKRVYLELIATNGEPIPMSDDTKSIAARVLTQLNGLLERSGAEAVNLSSLSDAERKAALAAHSGVMMIQLCSDPGTARIWFRRAGSSESVNMTGAMIDDLPKASDLAVRTWASRIHATHEAAGQVQSAAYLPPPGRSTYPEQKLDYVASNIAWGMYAGMLRYLGYRRQGTKTVEVSVMNAADQTPAAYTEVVLNRALRRITDERGVVVFPAVSIDDDDDVQPVDSAKYKISGVKTEIIH